MSEKMKLWSIRPGCEMPPTPLANACEIGWRRTERGRGRAIAAAAHAMAGATVAQKAMSDTINRSASGHDGVGWSVDWTHRSLSARHNGVAVLA